MQSSVPQREGKKDIKKEVKEAKKRRKKALDITFNPTTVTSPSIVDKKVCLVRTGLTGEEAGGAQLFCGAYADETQLHHNERRSSSRHQHFSEFQLEAWFIRSVVLGTLFFLCGRWVVGRETRVCYVALDGFQPVAILPASASEWWQYPIKAWPVLSLCHK